jgi:tetratricopeptide (TPR) repeat protein
MSESEIWNELGDIYYNTGAYDQAVLIYQKGLVINPSCRKSYCNLASIFIHQKRYAEAVPMLKKGIEFTEAAIDKASLWSQLGEAYRKLEENTNAANAFRKAVELSPHNPVFQKNLAEVEPTSQFISSESVNEKVEKTTLSPELVPSKGTLSAPQTSPLILGSRMLSEVVSDESVSENPHSLEDKDDLAQEIANRPDLAVSSDSEGWDDLHSGDVILPLIPSSVVEISNPSPQALLRLGILHWRKGEYERAIHFLKKAIDACDKSQNHFIKALCFNAIALVDTDLGRINEAIHAYQSAANLAPKYIFPWNNLGNLNCMLARYDEARAAYQAAIEHNPKNPVSWNGLGDVYHRLGRHEDAIAAYQLGNVFENHSNDKDALAEFEMSIDANQGDPQVWIEAGNIYLDINAYDDAIASFQKAMQLDPSNASIQARLAKAEKASEQVHSASKSPTHKTLSGIPPITLQGQTANNIPENSSSMVEAVADSVHEPSYWVFDAHTPPGNSRQSASQQTLAVAKTYLTKVEPILNSTNQTQVDRAFSNDQTLADIGQKHINVLVQLSPRPLKPATGSIINPATPSYDRASVRAEKVPESNQALSIESGSRPGAAYQGSAADDQADNQPSLDLRILEKDIVAYRRVTELNPKNDRAWDALGNMFEKVGLHEEAITAFEQAIALCPQKEAYHYHLGIAYAYQMHYDKAILALQRVVELNPDYVLAHCALAGYYRKLGMEKEAQEHINKARPSMVNESEYNQACFESISGNADRAFSFLEIALEKEQLQPAMVRNDPDLDFIRTDPRFEMLIQKNRIINI